MSRERRGRRVAWVGLWVVLVLLVVVGSALGAKPTATVTAASGELSVRRAGTQGLVALAVRGGLCAGDLVGTGANGKATLMFADGSCQKLAPNTALEITAPTKVGGKVSLCRAVSGQVWARLRPGQAVRGKSSVAGVRGTELLLSVQPDGTETLTVLVGEADFSNALGSVVVGENEQSVAQPGEPPGVAVAAGNTALLLEWTLELDRALIPREQAPPALAVEAARKTAEDRPGNAAAQAAYGDALLQAGRVDEAEPAYAAALGKDPKSVAALVGRGWAALERSRPPDAKTSAEAALAADAASGEAKLLLGLAQMRTPGELAAADATLRAAASMQPPAVQYQARSWLALVLLAEDDAPAALTEAQAAASAGPQSAVAHGNLALVCVFAGQPARAETEAALAARLNPDSVAAQCALGQARLAAGDVDGAVTAGMRATTLDPGLPEAHYLLGVAHAQRRDYRHAARELAEAVRLAPDFVAPAAALARVDTAMGRKAEALTLLTEMLARARNADAVHAALGQVHYQLAEYASAVAEYQEAVKLRPKSALHRAELCRVLMDTNRLNEAIAAGAQAVRLAPGVGQYHAVLGLAYDFARMSVQSEREYREALALDPRNALAHLVLGMKAATADPKSSRIFPKSSGLSLEDLLKQALKSTGSTMAVGSIAQASLYDPAVLAQTLRGGTQSTAQVQAGNHDQLAGALTRYTNTADGALHTYGLADYARDDGARTNEDTKTWGLSETAAWTAGPRTTLEGRASYRSTEQGLPGRVATPDSDDRSELRDTYVGVGASRRTGDRATVYGAVSYRDTRVELLDPDSTTFRIITRDSHGNAQFFNAENQTLTVRALVPELRAELKLGKSCDRESVLSVGGALIPIRFNSHWRVIFPSTPPVTIDYPLHLDGDLLSLYGQWVQQLGDRAVVAAQLRCQRFGASGWQGLIDVPGGTEPVPRSAQTYWLPSLVISYRPEGRTELRLFYNRQAPEQDLAILALAPNDTLLVTEPLTMVRGAPDSCSTVELEAERYLGSRGFLKAFVFLTTAKAVDFGDLPQMGEVRHHGIGVRYERQLTDRVFGQAAVLLNRTTNDTAFAPFDGGSAPYHPWRLAGLGLNYVDPRGTKVGLQANYNSAFFQDTGMISATTRPTYPGHVYLDLSVAREPSVCREFFVKVSNLFDTPAVLFNDFPTDQRRVVAGATLRW